MSARRPRSDKGVPKKSPIQHLLSRVKYLGKGQCWIWQGYVEPNGYGSLNICNKKHWAHRLSYQLHVGRIPDGLELDHLCRNPQCVNPEHLEPVTRRENMLRGESPAGQNARRTSCIHGHPFDEANTHFTKAGKRHCRACRRERQRRYYKAKAA